jgi:hypothetical protein
MSHDFIDSKKLAARITEVKAELAQLLHLESFLGTQAKRGRKPKGDAPVAASAKPKKIKRGKRGALGEGILNFLQPKGKEGAHVKDIAAGIGSKPANVTAYFYGTGKKVKGVKKHGGNVFSYVPKED